MSLIFQGKKKPENAAMRDLRLTVSCTVSLLSLAIMIRNQYFNVDTPTAKACAILLR